MTQKKRLVRGGKHLTNHKSTRLKRKFYDRGVKEMELVDKMLFGRKYAIRQAIVAKREYVECQEMYHRALELNRKSGGTDDRNRQLMLFLKEEMHQVHAELEYHRTNLRMFEWVLNHKLGHHVQVTKI